jgi:hypothetical protein
MVEGDGQLKIMEQGSRQPPSHDSSGGEWCATCLYKRNKAYKAGKFNEENGTTPSSEQKLRGQSRYRSQPKCQDGNSAKMVQHQRATEVEWPIKISITKIESCAVLTNMTF